MPGAITTSERIQIGVVLLIATILLFIVHSGANIAVWTALILRPFMHGVSLFKIDFLLLFLFLAGLSTLTGQIIQNKRTLALLQWWMIVAVGIGCCLGMVTFLSLAATLHIPLGKYAYFFSEGYNSVNQFAHLHVTKTGLFHLLSLLGLEQVATRADAGRPFVQYVDSKVAIAVLTMAAMALLTLLISARTVVRSWRGPRQVVALILYSLAGSHVVKCIIDGGPLAYDFLPSIIVVCLMFLHARGEDLGALLRRHWLRVLLLFLLFLSVTSVFSLDVAAVTQPQQYAFFLGLYFCLIAVLVYDLRNKAVLSLVAAPLLLWCCFYYYVHTAPDVGALNQLLSSGNRVFITSSASASAHRAPSTIDEVTATAIGKRAIDVYRDNGQSPLRNRALMIKSVDESGYTGFLFALRILKSDANLNFNSQEHMTIRGIATAGESADSMLVFRVDFDPNVFPSLWNASSTIVDENNKFAILYYLDNYFALHGLREYVLIPMYYEKEA